jgi:SAM-dependent methyltransferase
LIHFDPAKYGDSAASFYNQLYSTVERNLVTTLAGLAGSGPVLDLGIGTGRVAIPLLRAGVEVHGIEASSAMITVLRNHPEAKDIPVLHGEFSTTPFNTQYQLIYSLVSTFLLLPSLEHQQACFFNIARHLRSGGCFVSEIYNSINSFPEADAVKIPITTSNGIMDYHVTYLATPLHILDEMAANAGLQLAGRWSNWSQGAYTKESQRHISVYVLVDR